MKLRRFSRSERGAELVEFAMVMPFFLLLVAGIVDFARLFHSWEVTTNAAREGARVAVLPGYNVNDYAAARGRVTQYIAGSNADGTAVTQISLVPMPLTPGLPPGSAVNVTVTYTYNYRFIGPIMNFLNGTWSSALTHTATATMRTEMQVPVPPPAGGGGS